MYYSSDMLKGYVAVEGENISKAVSKLPHIMELVQTNSVLFNRVKKTHV